jgi:peptidyl-prolyl cis-trans isomerase A (cyclophilin A)
MWQVDAAPGSERYSTVRMPYIAIHVALALALLADVQAPLTKEQKLTPGTYARFSTTEGEFTARLFEDRAPLTVANFTGLAEGTKDPATGKPGQVKPFYDGLVFHRVIAGFMIQGGDPLGNGRGGPNYTFADEFDPKVAFDRAGLLAMANRGPNTNGSQFFITLAPTEWLNGKHTIFGEVVDGLDVVLKIGSLRTGPGDRPLTGVVIEKLAILRVKE